ncbi:peptidase S8 [Kitasatospora sp. NPDC085879]|uniref:S53 family peptidase n=1 Tax=Kitasatospora sp. NPDC085879 TaxID=3154769 RepID=UPI003436B8D3
MHISRTCHRNTVSVLSVLAFLAALAIPLTHAATASAAPDGPPVGIKHSAQICPKPKPKQITCDMRALTRADGILLSTPGPSGGLTPLQLRSAYRLPYNAGKGQTVTLIEAGDDPTAEADLAVYRSQFGLPPCTVANGCFRKVNDTYQNGPLPPTANAIGMIETSLDMDAVSAACPQCNIVLVEANAALYGADAMVFANYYAITTGGAKYLSNSWGGCEDSTELTVDFAFMNPGGAVTAAVGDFGYNTSPCPSPGPMYPATSPYVVAVGETLLTPADNQRGWTESVSPSTGSGCSLVEPAPAWQQSLSQAAGCNGKRVTNDIALAGDPNGGALAVYVGYGIPPGWYTIGGTSEAAPIAAAMFAMAGQPAAQGAASRLYGRPWAVNDITSGSNGTCTPAILCNAGPGWDGPSGVGSPTSLALFNP